MSTLTCSTSTCGLLHGHTGPCRGTVGSQAAATPAYDFVNEPPHYQHPSGVECIQVTEHMSFLRGNAVKYLWRAGSKGDLLEDLRKARWYVDREIQKVLREQDAAAFRRSMDPSSAGDSPT